MSLQSRGVKTVEGRNRSDAFPKVSKSTGAGSSMNIVRSDSKVQLPKSMIIGKVIDESTNGQVVSMRGVKK